MSKKLIGLVGSLALVCTLIISLTPIAGLVTPAVAAGKASYTSTRPQHNLIPATPQVVLAAQNQERMSLNLNLSPLQYDTGTLSAYAQNWANTLATSIHDPHQHSMGGKGPYGENIAAVSRNTPFSSEEELEGKLVQTWLNEKSNFIPGRKFCRTPDLGYENECPALNCPQPSVSCPYNGNISKTGSWRDVGHYTQLIWNTGNITRFMGCGENYDTVWIYLVCEYNPPGNMPGYDPLVGSPPPLPPPGT